MQSGIYQNYKMRLNMRQLFLVGSLLISLLMLMLMLVDKSRRGADGTPKQTLKTREQVKKTQGVAQEVQAPFFVGRQDRDWFVKEHNDLIYKNRDTGREREVLSEEKSGEHITD